MRNRSRQRGVSLIEVMMAVLIFSIGLIGLAGLLVMATRSNQAAYLRTQVTFLAHNMADRMAANPIGVWNGNYNSTGYPLTVTQDCSATSCTPALLAVHDKQMWSNQLTTFLPGAKASITCTNGNAGYTPTADQVNERPPYGGTCNMTITWYERGTGGNSGATNNLGSNPQTFAWEFQP